MLQGIWRKKIIQPIITLLKQGITYQKIALSIAFGISLGIFPLVGTSTLLCTLAAMIFRLNLPAVQLVNYLVYPLQLLLLIPFLRAGAMLFGDGRVPFTLNTIVAKFESDWLGTLGLLWESIFYAVIVWLLVGPPLTWLVHRLLLPVLRRLFLQIAPAVQD